MVLIVPYNTDIIWIKKVPYMKEFWKFPSAVKIFVNTNFWGDFFRKGAGVANSCSGLDRESIYRSKITFAYLVACLRQLVNFCGIVCYYNNRVFIVLVGCGPIRAWVMRQSRSCAQISEKKRVNSYFQGRTIEINNPSVRLVLEKGRGHISSKIFSPAFYNLMDMYDTI